MWDFWMLDNDTVSIWKDNKICRTAQSQDHDKGKQWWLNGWSIFYFYVLTEEAKAMCSILCFQFSIFSIFTYSKLRTANFDKVQFIDIFFYD